MCDTFKNEFQRKKFGLTHSDRNDFISAQWRWNPAVFLTYRVLVALYTTLLFVIVAAIENRGSFMAFLTNWSYMLLATYFLSSAVIAVYHHCKGQGRHRQPNESVTLAQANVQPRSENELKNIHVPTASSTNNAFQGLEQEDDDITWPMKVNWILGNIVQVFAVIVTAVYFKALYPLRGETDFRDINVHALNTFFILVDTCITARPVRLLHVIHPLIYGGIYLIHSAIYWSFDHEQNVLYPGVLDWNYPGTTSAIVFFLLLVVIPVLQLIYFVLYRLRVHISSIVR